MDSKRGRERNGNREHAAFRTPRAHCAIDHERWRPSNCNKANWLAASFTPPADPSHAFHAAGLTDGAGLSATAATPLRHQSSRRSRLKKSNSRRQVTVSRCCSLGGTTSNFPSRSLLRSNRTMRFGLHKSGGLRGTKRNILLRIYGDNG